MKSQKLKKYAAYNKDAKGKRIACALCGSCG